MLTITAVIKTKPGHEDAMREALLKVGAYAQANEPGTIGYFISVDAKDPSVFTTYERYVDQAAMDSHNNSEAVASFFSTAKPLIDGEVTLVIATELLVKT